LLKALRSLAEHPQRCSLAPENEVFEEEIRQLLYGKRQNVSRILFTIREQTVYILHIRHAARPFLQPE
jgi:plasmid stabilization system protein ParE